MDNAAMVTALRAQANDARMRNLTDTADLMVAAAERIENLQSALEDAVGVAGLVGPTTEPSEAPVAPQAGSTDAQEPSEEVGVTPLGDWQTPEEVRIADEGIDEVSA